MRFALAICFLTFNLISCIEYSEIVELPTGKVRGDIEYWRDSPVYQYKGIPYATPPVGPLRYSKPIEAKSWTGIKDTISFGKACPQKTMGTKDKDQDEDCLFLNIYVNKDTFDNRDKELKPVMVYIHGGAFLFGSGHDEEYLRGKPLVIIEDVILVTINYRLGVLGFLNPGNLIPGLAHNLGLWDQNLALQWVNQNIHLFGGDPNKITLFGQSAGSMSVSAQILSPHSRGLFRGAIMESGAIFGASMPGENTTKAIKDFIDYYNCTNVADRLECVRSIPWQDIINNPPKYFLSPTFGDQFLPLQPEMAIASRRYNDVNLLAGAERDEADGLICGTYKFAHLKSKTSQTGTYSYIHTQAPLKPFNNFDPNCGRTFDKVCHCDELPFVFGAPLREPSVYDADDRELSVRMMNIWGEFARSGKPAQQGPIRWPMISEKSSKVINLMELNNKFIGKVDTVTGTNCLAK